LALTRPVAGTALAIAMALPNTPSQSRRDKPDLVTAFVLENEGTETLEEFITVVLMVFSLLVETFRCDQYRPARNAFPIAVCVTHHHQPE
jgi:hypothetical protein